MSSPVALVDNEVAPQDVRKVSPVVHGDLIAGDKDAQDGLLHVGHLLDLAGLDELASLGSSFLQNERVFLVSTFKCCLNRAACR